MPGEWQHTLTHHPDGLRRTVSWLVWQAIGAGDTGTGGGPEHNVFPRVLGTARLISLMELAAARAMEPMLRPGELTAGIVVRIEHVAPTPLGGTVRMTARYLGREGKHHRFEVIAADDAGETFRGQHIRAVVEARRLEKGASRRLRV